MGAASIDGHFKVELDKQSAEDTIVNGTQTDYDYKSAGWRHPLLLYVDGVVSPHLPYSCLITNKISSMKAI